MITSSPFPRPAGDLDTFLFTAWGVTLPRRQDRPCEHIGPHRLIGIVQFWQAMCQLGLAQAVLNYCRNEWLIAAALSWYARFGPREATDA